MKIVWFCFLCCIVVHSQDTIIQIKISTKLRTNGDGIYELTAYAPKKAEKYKFSEYKTGFWKIVKSDSTFGWIPTSCIYNSTLIEGIIRKDKEILMTRKYGNIGSRIAHGGVWIGMTKEMLTDSKGFPDEINTTKGTNYKTEQWIYKSHYIYLEKNVVTAIQN